MTNNLGQNKNTIRITNANANTCTIELRRENNVDIAFLPPRQRMLPPSYNMWQRSGSVWGVLANCQSTTIFLAHSTTVASVSIISSQTMRLRCFQMLQRVVVIRWAKLTYKLSSSENIASVADVVVDRAF